LRLGPTSALAGHQARERTDAGISQAEIRRHEAGPPGGGVQELQAGQARQMKKITFLKIIAFL
jgi:hypothetical protein